MNTHNKEHAELHKKIWDCSCTPYLKDWKYCQKCKDAVLEFMDEFGAGVLTNDLKIEGLENKCSKLEKENKSLNQRLQDKIKRVEELKERCSP